MDKRGCSVIWSYPNFSKSEFSCKCGCGDSEMSAELLNRLQSARTEIGKPFRINSAKRCRLHNARVGGAPMSFHKTGEAVDISTNGHDREALFKALMNSGFTGFGFYQTFIHVDIGRPRSWSGGKESDKLWQF